MEITKFDEITSKLEKTIDHARFVHTLGVAFTAASIAFSADYDPEKALLAGLLHDCAKCFPTDEKLELCREGGVVLSEIEISNPALIHAKLGPYIAKRDYGVEDEEILEAIRTHTTGEPAMTLLQKIIFIADMIEPNRDDIIPEMDRMRYLAYRDIDEAVFVITERNLKYLQSRPDKVIDPMTRETYEYYKERHNGN